jgi:hypothetical protein
MPKKSKSAPAFPNFEPFVFEMGIFPDGDGGLAIRYESTDERADEVCSAVVKAIADSIGFVADEV